MHLTLTSDTIDLQFGLRPLLSFIKKNVKGFQKIFLRKIHNIIKKN